MDFFRETTFWPLGGAAPSNFFKVNNIRDSGSILTERFSVDVSRGRGDNVGTIFTSPAPRNLWRPKNVQNSARFLTTFDFDRE